VTFKQLFKVKLIAPSYVPLETIQLLYETFFDTWPPKRVIGGDRFKDTQRGICNPNWARLPGGEWEMPVKQA